jgi:hypothetical protein
MAGGLWTDPVDVGVEAVPTTLLTNIADNLRCLHSGNGNATPSVLNITTSPSYLELPNSTEETFKVNITDYAQISYIYSVGRRFGNRIQLLCYGASNVSIAFYSVKSEGTPGGYSKIKIYGATDNTPVTWSAYPACGIQFIFDGEFWVAVAGIPGIQQGSIS